MLSCWGGAAPLSFPGGGRGLAVYERRDHPPAAARARILVCASFPTAAGRRGTGRTLLPELTRPYGSTEECMRVSRGRGDATMVLVFYGKLTGSVAAETESLGMFHDAEGDIRWW